MRKGEIKGTEQEKLNRSVMNNRCMNRPQLGLIGDERAEKKNADLKGENGF